MENEAFFEYVDVGGTRLFCAVVLPSGADRVPTVIWRTPYVASFRDRSEDFVLDFYKNLYSDFTDRGYAVVCQHCRGRGKSEGIFVPYLTEHTDALELRRWIRTKSFYNGEIFLLGASYTASQHFASHPFEDDIKGAVFEVQDSERYRLWYRNGQARKQHANWYFSLYPEKSADYGMHSFMELPQKGLCARVLGHSSPDFDGAFCAEDPRDPFWSTYAGGTDTRGALDNADFPILLLGGYCDIYAGGMFRMWNEMSDKTRKNSAFLVSPYNHGDSFDEEKGLRFELASRAEHFGKGYKIDWFDSIRLGTPLPYEKGKINYYRCFEDSWGDDFYFPAAEDMRIPLGSGNRSFIYDPTDPPSFEGDGLLQSPPYLRSDVISIYTEPLGTDLFIKGRMRARLCVCSDAEDTSFYMRISIEKPNGDFGLRHDITSLCYQHGSYRENEKVYLDFCFDEHAFSLGKKERLRIDIAPTDNTAYIRHTNKKGPFCEQTKTAVAKSTVYLDRSELILPVE